MIKNEKQYNITRKKLRDFKVALRDIKDRDYATEGDLKKRIQIQSIEVDMKKLKTEIAEFEKLRSGKVQVIVAHSIQELPNILIKARIARSMSQKELAETLGMKEQQIQRYESNNYSSASLAKIEQIVEALEISIEEKARLV